MDAPGSVWTRRAPGATSAIGWMPPYPYVAGTASAGIRQHVLDNAGAGKLDLHPLPMP